MTVDARKQTTDGEILQVMVYGLGFTGLPWENKPKEYPQQRETKTVAKYAMNEVCLLPRPFYSRGRACKLQSRH